MNDRLTFLEAQGKLGVTHGLLLQCDQSEERHVQHTAQHRFSHVLELCYLFVFFSNAKPLELTPLWIYINSCNHAKIQMTKYCDAQWIDNINLMDETYILVFIG
jgi:hypothetical protein